MEVNAGDGDIGHSQGRRSQADRSAATRGALLAAARELFATKGFAATGREEIVEAAGVTRGALYHHFANKEDVFRSVFVELETEVGAKVAAAAGAAGDDPMAQFRDGARAFLDAALDPAVQQVVLIDAPSVLGWEERAALSETYGLGLVRDGLRALMDAGAIDPQPVDPLAHVLLAALHEAALFVARASDHDRARAEVGTIVDRLVDNLRRS